MEEQIETTTEDWQAYEDAKDSIEASDSSDYESAIKNICEELDL